MTAIAPSDKKIIAEILRNVQILAQNRYGKNAVLNAEKVILRAYPYSFFLHIPIETQKTTKTILAKIKRQPYMHTISEASKEKRLGKPAQDEYEMTKKIQAAFTRQNCSGCTAVVPLAYLPQWNALLIEKIEGRALKSYLLSRRIFLRSAKAEQEIEKYISASARWLRVFHREVSGMQMRPFPAELVRNDTEESLTGLQNHARGQINISLYREAFKNALKQVQNAILPYGIVHDDFHYSNILIDKRERVCAIDNAGNYQHCLYVDIATLITDPQTRTAEIASKGLLISPSYIRRWKEIILDRYFEKNNYDKNALAFFSALAVLNKWSEGLSRLSLKYQGKIPTLILRWTDAYFSTQLSAYLSEITSFPTSSDRTKGA